jgi:hypothetical protein
MSDRVIQVHGAVDHSAGSLPRSQCFALDTPAQSRPKRKRSNMLASLPQAWRTPAQPAGCCCIASDQRPGGSSVLTLTIMQVRQQTKSRLGESGQGGLKRIKVGLRG